MAAMEVDVVVRDSRLATANQIARSSKVVLDVVVNVFRTRLEMGTVDSSPGVSLAPNAPLWRS